MKSEFRLVFVSGAELHIPPRRLTELVYQESVSSLKNNNGTHLYPSPFSFRSYLAQFDLDDTLYINERVPEFVRAMIIDYIEKMLHVPHAEAVQLCMKYYLESGTTLAGLCIHGHSIDFDHWHAHVSNGAFYDG